MARLPFRADVGQGVRHAFRIAFRKLKVMGRRENIEREYGDANERQDDSRQKDDCAPVDHA